MMEGMSNGGAQADNKVVESFQRSFGQVQSILDQNRLLINEINQNHESRAPDNLTHNVSLIRDLNNNIRQVVHLYSDLSTSVVKSVDTFSDGDSSAKPTQKRARPS